MTDSERVDVPVWVYLHNESERFKRLYMQVHVGEQSPLRALEELLQSHANILHLLAQLQKAKDEGQ